MKFDTKTINMFIGQKVSAPFLLVNVESKNSPKAKWQELILSDANGSITARVWEKYMSDTYTQMVGKIVAAAGDVIEYNGNADFHVEKLSLIELEDISGVIPSSSPATIETAIKYIRTRAEKVADPALRNYCLTLMDETHVNKYREFPDTEGIIFGGFFVEMAYFVNVFTKMISFCEKKESIDQDLIFASLILYGYGNSHTFEKDGYSYKRKTSLMLTGRGFNAGVYALAEANAFNKARKDNLITAEVICKLQHCVLCMDGMIRPQIKEAELSALVVETYFNFTKGARVNGRI